MRQFLLFAFVGTAAVTWFVRPFAFAADPTKPVPQVATKPLVAGPAVPFGPTSPAEEDADVVSETIGTLSGAYLNQAYLSIGILGDAVAAEVYDAEEAQDLLDVHLGLAAQAEKQLAALAASRDLSPDDAAGVKQLVKIATLIRVQGETLHLVWLGEESKIAVWEKLREDTADEIEKFFGAEEETK